MSVGEMFVGVVSGRGNIRRRSVRRGSVRRGCIHRGIVRRGSVRRGCINRGNFRRGSVRTPVKDPDYAAKLINRMDKMINIEKNKTLGIARKQGEIFKKFKTVNKFMRAIKKFNISKATINFKIAVVEFINMYPRMEKSGISLYYLKNNFKIIKEVCKDNAYEFKYFLYKNF